MKHSDVRLILFFMIILLIFVFTKVVLAATADEIDTIEKQLLETRKQLTELRIENIELQQGLITSKTTPSFIADVSAYCPCMECSEGWGNKTASTAIAKPNHTIAMDRTVPFGTKAIIESFDGIIFEVEDRGGAIKGNKVDIYMSTHSQVEQFGRQNLRIWLIYIPIS